MEKSLFFIGICPPHPIEEAIHRIKEEFNQKYGIKGAFRSKAHITLQMPFRLTPNKAVKLTTDLSAFLKEYQEFKVNLKDFGKFEPRVIFVQVEQNIALEHLQKGIQRFMKQFQIFDSTHKNRGFHPHVTVAFRDLKKSTFYQIWEEVKSRDFEASFEARAVTIFKHNGKSWDVFKELPIGA